MSYGVMGELRCCEVTRVAKMADLFTIYDSLSAVSHRLASSHTVSHRLTPRARAVRRDDFGIFHLSLLNSQLFSMELRPVFSGNTSRDFGRQCCRQCGLDRQKAVYFTGGICRLVDFSALSILPGGETLSFVGRRPYFLASCSIAFGSVFKE